MKKLLSILLCALLSLSVLPASAMEEGVGGVMTLSAGNTTEFAGGTGSASDPYLISTKEHLNNVRNYLNAYFKMTGNLVFTEKDFAEGGAFDNDGQGWVPIGREGTPFKGVFDGDGHTIRGLVVQTTGYYAGLFGYVEHGTIRNVGMVGAEISLVKNSGDCYAGGIAGYVDYGTISGCYNTGNVSASPASSGRFFAGGIVGATGGHNFSRQDVAIEKCYNTGDVSAKNEAGGIVGRVGNKTIIKKCHNTGNVSAEDEAGGIVGNSCFIDISECYNKGSVSGNYAGGIMGAFYKGFIEKCYNTGSVSGNYADTINIYAGGIIGDMSCAETTWQSLRECYNTGRVSVTSTAKSTRNIYTGGIVGNVDVEEIDIYNCYNTGSVSATFAADATGDISIYAAGIVGQLFADIQAESSMSNCYNTGSISADVTGNISIYAGGIAGRSFDVQINNCYYLNTCAQKGVGEGAYFATRYTSEQLKNSKSFVGFDFDSVWTMAGNEKYLYPELQKVPMDFDFSPGDLDGNGKINSLDGVMIKRYFNKWNDLNIAAEEALDVNKDKSVNSVDALILMRYLNGWKITLG